MREHRILNKPAALMLAAALCSVLLSACNSNDNLAGSAVGGDNNGAVAAGNNDTAADASLDNTEPIIEITAWDQPAPDDPGKPFIESRFKLFEELHPNIKVKHVEAFQTNVREKFMTAVAGGEGPDVMEQPFPDMQLYMQKGIAADITDLMNRSPDKSRFIDGAFDLAMKDGRIYGIPSFMYSSGLLYNKSMFKNAGIVSPPKTWDEFAEAAKKVQQHNPDTIGFDILGMDWADWHFEYYVWQAGGDLTELQPNGTVKLMFSSEAAVKALQYYKDLKWTHKVTQKNVVQDYNENLRDFYTGRSAMILGSSDSFGNFLKQGMKAEDIGFTPFPVGPSGRAPSQVGGNFWMLNPKSTPEQQKAAFEYAMFFLSKEHMEAWAQFCLDNGFAINPLSIVKDFDVTKWVKDLPPDYVAAVQATAKDKHLEYYLKSSLSSYLVKPIQRILLDPSADPATELKAAEALAQKEVIDKYNSDILAGSK
ncbi:extracellular solute-binding protein [Paenibacillus sp. BC26]|uniref:extracellular solute-binding protein n=1 Tax=Paenibacillus sp. BC26 TaxID=1881032 RepID=UPI0008E0F7F9|nr:extracellular solute-binding protein [Paenibacillus sp. BC26]SFT04214.1 ABC-type glycerol-3-phosphate transport system, substrate-binding protein [Paenibacillus sp. BC26]